MNVKKKYTKHSFPDLRIVLGRLEPKTYLNIARMRHDLLCSTLKYSKILRAYNVLSQLTKKTVFTTVTFIFKGIKILFVSDSGTIGCVSVPLNATSLNILKT